MRKWYVFLLIGLFLLPSLAVAQDDGKMEPFLQSDLKVLLGDVQRPNGIFWHEGYLYTGCAGDWTIYRIDAETGDTITYMFGVKNAHSLYVETDASGGTDLWAADFQDSKFVVVNPGDERGLFPIKEGLAAPWGLTPSATDDTFFMSEWQSDNLVNITRDGNITLVASGFADPTGIVATETEIYIGNNASARRSVEWLDLSGEGDPNPQPLVTGLQNVTNLIMAEDGYLYIAYALGTRGVVGRVDPEVCKENGGCSNVDVELVLWTELAAPLAGLTITPEMRLFVHTQFGTEIYWLDLEAERS